MSLVLPVKNDLIDIEGGRYTVIEYTGLKPKPAVYIDTGEAVYFDEILKINGVKVELDKDSNCIKAYGNIKRKFHIPQPMDTIRYIDYKNQTQILVVTKLKLHKRDDNYLHFCDDEICILINNIIDVDHIDGDVDGRLVFDRDKFLEYYKDYCKKV